jgi:hypothetical protein
VDVSGVPAAGIQQSYRMPHRGHCRQLERRHPRTGQAAGRWGGSSRGLCAVATRPESRVKNHLKAVMASVQRTTVMTLGGVISVHKTRVLWILRSPAFPTNRTCQLLIVGSDSKAVSSGLSELGIVNIKVISAQMSTKFVLLLHSGGYNLATHHRGRP